MEPTIRAVNKKTGQVFEGTISEARKRGFSDEFIASKIEAAQKVESLTGGDVGQVKGTAEQEFKKSAAGRALGELENLYFRGDTKGEQSVGLSKTSQRTEKARAGIDAFVRSFVDPKYQEDVNKFKSQRDITVGILTQAFGSGTPQEGEAKRLIASAPNETSTSAEAKSWFKSARTLLGTHKEEQDEIKKDNQVPSQPAKPLRQQIKEGIGNVARGIEQNPIIDLLFGGTKNIIRDVVQSPIASQRTANTNSLIQQGEQLSNMAMNEKDPVKRKQMLAQANEILAQTGSEAQDVSNKFSDRVQENPIARAALAAPEVPTAVSTIMGLPGLLKGGANLARGGVQRVLPKSAGEGAEQAARQTPKLLEILRPGQAGKVLRDTGIAKATKEGVEVVGDDIVKGIEKWASQAKRANPTQVAKIDQFVEGATNVYKGQKVPVAQAFEDWLNAQRGFTTGGIPRTPLQSGYDRAVRETLRPLMEKAAPGFDKGTKLIRKGIERGKFVKKVGPPLVGTVVGGGILGKLFGVGAQGAVGK
mgnify:CR=1 FL=1